MSTLNALAEYVTELLEQSGGAHEPAAELEQALRAHLSSHRTEVLSEAKAKACEVAASLFKDGETKQDRDRAGGAQAVEWELGLMAKGLDEPTQPADFFQPGRTYTSHHDGYTAPECILQFRVEHVTRHPERGHLRAFGWLRTAEPGALWRGDYRDEREFSNWTEE